MNQTVHTPEVYDFRQYDRIWQRVAPNLEPYPGMTAAAPSEPVPAVPAVPVPTSPGVQAAGGQASGAQAPAVQGPGGQSAAALPGAAPDPCCMGTAAAEMLNVLTGYIEDARSDRQAILALVRLAPSWARQRLRDIAADLGEHARRLMAAHYLITGTCYRPCVQAFAPRPERWCPALRERYHAAACAGLNYARSAADTADPCLSALLGDLSTASYRHAETLLHLLERSLQ